MSHDFGFLQLQKYTIKEAGELWKLKSEKERNGLNANYLKEVEMYKHELLQWEEKWVTWQF